MAATHKIVFNFKGGIVSPGYLMQILQTATTAAVQQVRLGLRQQLLLDIPASHMAAFKAACSEQGLHFYHQKTAPPNLVSSYLAADYFAAESWLREGIYKDVLTTFDKDLPLAINLCDTTQQLVPLFTGHLNWVASATPHFWFLYMQPPGATALFCWPEMIYTNDIAPLSNLLSNLVGKGIQGEAELFAAAKKALPYHAQPIGQKLLLPDFSLPYYEGFNKAGNNLWLGIYRRDEFFPVDFLMEVCRICQQTKIGELYTTPWKSLIVKGIIPADRKRWDTVLGRYRINVRHAANELNWQVDTDEGLLIKRLVIRQFDKEDVRTYGLCFAVATRPGSRLFGSVIIQKEAAKNNSRLKTYDRYSILYKKDFNPNTGDEIIFRNNVKKEYLGNYLVALCSLYYEQISGAETTAPALETATPATTILPATHALYQCRYCFSIYDEAVGDEMQDIVPGTAFNQLPSHFTCSVCDSGKEAFLIMEAQQLALLV